MTSGLAAPRRAARVAAGALLVFLAGCGGNDNNTRLVQGPTQQVGSANVSTWARVDDSGVVTEAGATVPASVFDNPPAAPGAGPAGALVTIPFPSEVQNGTFLNHFEMHWEPSGHPPAVFQVPHFDLHFYAISPTQVEAIAPPDTAVPAADRIPAGYAYPGTDQLVPQMGVHAVNPADLNGAFSKVMVLGYQGGNMILVEPMVTQALLQQRQSFTMAVPQPQVLGRATRYPTRFTATYNPRTQSYDLVLSDFVTFSQ